MKQNVLNALLGGALLLSAPLFTSCQDILGEWDRPTPASGGSGGSASKGIEYVAYSVSGTTATPSTETVTDYTDITGAITELTADKPYVVKSDVTITGNITLSGNAKIILCDGATLTINGHINDTYDGLYKLNNSLAIFGQSTGTGKIVVKTTADDDYPITAKDITIHGGLVEVTATGASTEAIFTQNDLVIYNGTVTANATMVTVMANHAMYIYGGSITAIGGSTSAISYDTGGTGSIYYYGGNVIAIASGTGTGFGGAFTNSSSAAVQYDSSTNGTSWTVGANVSTGSTGTPTTLGVRLPGTCPPV